jgi:hypothetical protein
VSPIFMFRRSILLSEVFAFAALLAASCSTDPGLISEQARDIALKASNSGHLRAIEAPSSVRTELLTLETADKQIGQSGDYWERQTPDMKVWLVTVEGTWAIFHQYTIVLDAMTGEIIGEMATS